MINYAHRGASEYAPENTLSSFYLGLLQGANGIETDVQRTKDGVLVLFHDNTLDRVTDSTGRVQDYTLAELKKVKVIGNSPRGFYDRIPTFREFLEAFSEYDIQFAIELKAAGVEQDVVEMIHEFGVENKTTVTSFQFEYIKKVKEIDANMRIGYLVKGDGCDHIEELKAIGGEEMAPKAGDMSEESVAALRDAGLGVRAWGLANQELMRKMCELKVDGMTVNFPDKLYERLVRPV
ncbi:MAG: hypothetical protein IJZ34_05360 [Lachnospiraceae bacterium]|nr:hypothetical protein [Lachnospiraceae bacterium]